MKRRWFLLGLGIAPSIVKKVTAPIVMGRLVEARWYLPGDGLPLYSTSHPETGFGLAPLKNESTTIDYDASTPEQTARINKQLQAGVNQLFKKEYM